MKHMSYWSFGIRTVIPLILLWLPQHLQAQGAPKVNVVTVQEAEVVQTSDLVGSIHPFKRSVIASEIAGLVKELPVDVGDRLEKNQLIGHLRDSTQRLALEEANATLNQLQAELDELEAGTRVEEKERARGLMEEAKAVYDKWKSELDRLTRLREQKSASAKEFNDTTWDTAAAKARFAQAKAEFELAEAGPRAEVIARARHAVEAQRAVVDRLEYDLALTEIHAPFTGYVVSKHTEVGQWIMAGGSVVEMIDLSRVKISVDVPESFITFAKPGTPVVVAVDALGKSYRSEISRVVPDANTKARAFPIEIDLPNEELDLRSGMFVRARVPSGPEQRSLIVPRDAVIQRQGSYLVIMVSPGIGGDGEMGYPVPVKLGADVGAWVAVSSPQLQSGMNVAVKGHDRIYGPQPVQSLSVEMSPPPSADIEKTESPAASEDHARQRAESDPAVARSE